MADGYCPRLDRFTGDDITFMIQPPLKMFLDFTVYRSLGAEVYQLLTSRLTTFMLMNRLPKREFHSFAYNAAMCSYTKLDLRYDWLNLNGAHGRTRTYI